MRKTVQFLVFSCFALTIGASTGNAQTLYAFVSGPSAQPVIHELPLNCGPSLRQCPVPATAIGPVAHGIGGIALFARNLTVTDGLQHAEINTACQTLQSCAYVGYGPISDIAYDETPGAIRVLATDGNSIAEFAPGCPRGAPLGRWTVPVLQGPLDALAWDRQSGNIWVTDSAAHLYEVQRTGPWSCKVLRMFPILDPQGGLPALPIGGLAVHPCSQRIFVADAVGRIFTVTSNGIPLSTCVPASFTNGEFILGLAIRPKQAVALGTGCSGPGSPACQPVATTANESVIPNPSFRIDLQNAPIPSGGTSLATLLLSVTPGPLSHPLLCTPLQLGGSIIAVTSTAVSPGIGTAPCHGSAFGFLPLPNSPGLCGLTLYTQWVIISQGSGIALSNGLAITLD
ncbi:MAG: hypothetical protein GY944_19480 [bacterium]|nr:hypothetical protein [bacterium]